LGNGIISLAPVSEFLFDQPIPVKQNISHLLDWLRAMSFDSIRV
jgi:hypothetical protein